MLRCFLKNHNFQHFCFIYSSKSIQFQKEVDLKNLKSKAKKDTENNKQLEAIIKDLEETKNNNRSEEKEYQKEVQILRQNSEKHLKKLNEEVEELRKYLNIVELRRNDFINFSCFQES